MKDKNNVKVKLENRKIYIDILKIIAILFVFYNHTGRVGFSHFLDARDSNFYFLDMAISIMCKVAVPIFFMCSGALLLGKEESLKKVIKKRFIKYFIVILISSIILYVYLHFRVDTSGSFSIMHFINKIYTGQVVESYWYLYTYLAYLLMLPIIRKFVKEMSQKEYLYMIILFAIINILPIIDFLIFQGKAAHNGNFYFFITTSYLFYPMIGYFIDNKLDRKYFNRKKLIIMIIASCISIIISCLMTNYKCNLLNTWEEDTSQTFFNNLSFIPTITLFYGIKMLVMDRKMSERLTNIIAFVGSTTFGLYLFEKIFRQESVVVYFALWKYIHRIPASIAWVVAEFIIGVIVIAILKKIPVIKKYI
ncbi:MAG: acyltransferase family protein [Clostridia bacterium]|nr:acyltransferase family protein [Clostridia bacterium]